MADLAKTLATYRISGLDPKAAKFVLAFLGEANFVASKAAASAGISASTARSMLKRPEVAEAIRRQLQRIQERFELTVEDVVKELALIGFARMGSFTQLDETGRLVPALEKCSPEELAAVSALEYEENEIYGGRGDKRAVVGVNRKTKFKLHDKRAALVDLRKHLGGQYDAQKSGPESGAPPGEDQDLRTKAQRLRQMVREIEELDGDSPDA